MTPRRWIRLKSMEPRVTVSSLAGSSVSPVAVAIPARNEADWIARCLTALDRQRDGDSHRVVLLVNNSTDATGAIARSMQPSLSFTLDVVEHDFPAGQQTAGQARHWAMERAAGTLPLDGVLLSTDADGQVAPDWLAANLSHLRRGAEAVAGQAVLDAADAAAIPAALHEDDARECAYTALLDEIDHLLDPDPADPWPRHTEHSGASICVTLGAYRRAGGIPPIAVGEDRAFFAALRRADVRIRHAPDVHVTVSGRIDGRAVGGMADTIRRRLVAPDPFLDDALEPAANRKRRVRLRGQVRRLFHGQGEATPRLAWALGCDAAVIEAALRQATFGRAWEMIEGAAARLAAVQVPVCMVAEETREAKRIIAVLRGSTASFVQRDKPDYGVMVPSMDARSGMFRKAG